MSARSQNQIEHNPASVTGPQLVSRMVVSVLALIGALISLYLVLNHYGLASLACPISGCDKVQASVYSSLLGVPVAGFGLVGFAIILGLGIAGLSSNHMFGIPIQDAIIWITGVGVAAYLVLTYLELFVIHAICFWCVCTSLCMLGALISALLGRRVANSSV
jgi:uncharacterized membrane protein